MNNTIIDSSSDDENYENYEIFPDYDISNKYHGQEKIDDLLYNPYNSLNKEIDISDIQNILSKYDINIKPYNIEIYKRAFVHKSYTKRPKIDNINSNITLVDKPDNCLSLKTKSNERLEFVGDGVLECVIKFYLYKRFPKNDEGFMTEKKIALVKNEHIGKLALELGLQNYFIISKNAEEKNIRTNLKKLGCLFEAFIGALFLDFNKIVVNDEYNWFNNVFVSGPGLQVAQLFIERVIEKHVDWTELINNNDNYKNRLQVIIQKEFKITPDYIELKDNKNNKNNEDNLYVMGVYICFNKKIYDYNIEDSINFDQFNSFEKIHQYLNTNNELLVFLSKSEHKIKKKAEQLACKIAIEKIEKIEKI